MISRDALRRLAEFQSPKDSAISFYFQPRTPQDRSHRDEAIQIKDLVKQAQREAGQDGKNAGASDLARILALAERLDGNHSRAKAIFACETQGLWEEFDLPARLARTELIVNRRFHLKPLMAVVDALPRTCIVLMDRKRARIYDLWANEIREVLDIQDELPRHGRSDGWAGYDAGHMERHVGNEAMRHIKNALDRVMERHTAGEFDKLIIGCRDEIWSDIERQLHPYLRQTFVGRFSRDVATATPEEVRDDAEQLLKEQMTSRQQGLIHEVLGEAQRDGRGAVGLRRVLESLERGEVQALLIGESFKADAVECPNCGHVDTRTGPSCAMCSRPTRPLSDVADALVGLALRNSAELVEVVGDTEFEKAGNVAALLRFRADQNTPAKVAS
jgi:peptide subunit release factor 1 (eRF1)